MAGKANRKNGLNRCPYCGATDLDLNVKSGKLRCNYCRAMFENIKVNAHGGVEELDGITIGSGAEQIVPDEKTVMTFKCGACGAEVVVDTNEATSAKCHWCRHVLSVNDKVPNGAVPDIVLPFSLEKAVAENNINSFVKNRQFFAHPQFKKEFTTENVMGVYLPYMVIDVNGHVKLVGQAEHLVRSYTVKVGKHTQRRYDADLYDVERDFDLLVDDLTIEASRDKLDQNVLVNTNNVINAIMPFDTENCVAWDANFLRGFASEKRDTDVEDLRERVRTQVKDIARCRANTTMEFYGRGARWDKEELEVKGAKWKAAYLPVWLYSYLQDENGKKVLHYVAVNARTGETMGSVPIYKGKLLAISALVELVGIIVGTFLLITMETFETDEGSVPIGLLGYAAGFIFYWAMKRHYRNMDKRHYHEAETKANMKNMKRKDQLVERRKGLSNSRMSDANNEVVCGAGNKKLDKMKKIAVTTLGELPIQKN